MNNPWQFWLDVGGTFTDCFGISPNGLFHTCKILSSNESPILGIQKIMEQESYDNPAPMNIRLGTTRGTNALLERKGAKVALITTEGFRDLWKIGTQAREDLFSLHIKKPEKLYHEVVEIPERISASGEVLLPLSEDTVREHLSIVKSKGIDSIAICFLNAYRNSSHENSTAKIAREIGFSTIAVSSELSPTIKVLDRGDTSVVEAYLSPIIRQYIQNIRSRLPECKLRLMTSSGGLVDANTFVSKDSILSGPAGGVTGFSFCAQRAGFLKAIGCDMGGTSTDVSRFDGEHEYQFTTKKAGVRIVAPMYAIETVAAGGGSICHFDGQRFLVGPESAGATPGPACYGKGGPLTVTDINLFNGKIDEQYFPFPLDKDAVLKRLKELAADIRRSTDKEMDLSEIADGFTNVANLKMATAIEQVSTSRGYNPEEYALVAFGGAAPQHACALAKILGIQNILVPPYAGILSAYGIGMADIKRHAEKSVLLPLSPETLSCLEETFQDIESRLYREILDEGISSENIPSPQRLLDLRYIGEEAAITVRAPHDNNYFRAFSEMHQQLYGHVHNNREVEIATLRVELTGYTPKPPIVEKSKCSENPTPKGKKEVIFEGRSHETSLYERKELKAGQKISGPAIIVEEFSTILVDPNWLAEVTSQLDIRISPKDEWIEEKPSLKTRNPITLEIFNNHFTHIATQMGITLQRTALSVNVKERLDFSCAILSAEGDLVVNAPHIPVHLGAMGETVKSLLSSNVAIKPGDVYLSNDPDLGGSHLPDLTVMTPVFNHDGDALLFFTASRAHHAEIGGIKPGSTYPFAKNLVEEGVILRNIRVQEEGFFCEERITDILTKAPYPSRCPKENIADIKAAIAANQVGALALLEMIKKNSWPVVSAYMKHIRDAAEEKTVEALNKIGDGAYTFEDSLDDESLIKVSIKIQKGKMHVDFSGSSAVHPNSLNANRAIVQSSLLYCLRCLIDEDIPMNSGVMAPLEIKLPSGLLNPPANEDPALRAAVVGGNVEVSQRIVDVIFGALKIAAASQGTMNNFVFGNETFGYYETLCGGTGAGKNYNGCDAVHSHMTNTRLTDVEILEQRYPVRVLSFQIRKGSGGNGFHCGGNGIIRKIEFLSPLEVSLLTQRREKSPYGLEGGGDGLRGQNLLHKKSLHKDEILPSLSQFKVEAGDVLTLLTPGGGAWGKAP